MVADRLVDIFTLMERFDRLGTGPVALCTVAAEFMELDGAGIVLTSDVDGLNALCTSDETARKLVNLEIVVGEGPGVDACRHDAVEEPNLLHPKVLRWPTYTPQAIELGASAAFGFSIRLGAIRFGALTLFRRTPGSLTATQVSDGYLMASVIARAVLTQQAGATSDSLVGELEQASVLDFSVHQAAGMLAVQGSMSVKDAMVTMRAHTFASGCQLSELAQQVVSRQVFFDAASATWKISLDNVLGGRLE